MRQKILLIENDELFRWQLLHFLGDHHYQTMEAEDGPTGLQLAKKNHPNLVLCAINMPCFNGYDVLKMFRRHPEMDHIPFIFLTKRSEYERKSAVHVGATDLLTKALSFENILERILPHLKNTHPINSSISQSVIPEI